MIQHFFFHLLLFIYFIIFWLLCGDGLQLFFLFSECGFCFLGFVTADQTKLAVFLTSFRLNGKMINFFPFYLLISNDFFKKINVCRTSKTYLQLLDQKKQTETESKT